MYKLIEWTDDLRTGIPELDEHHRILVEQLNELHAAIHRRQGLEACREILQRMLRFADVHFTLEQDYLRRNDRDQVRRHREDHGKLTMQINALLGRIDTFNSTVSFHRLHQLRLWLLQHILAADEGISRYRRSRDFHEEARQQRLERLRPMV